MNNNNKFAQTLFLEKAEQIADCWKEYVEAKPDKNNGPKFCSVINKKLNLSMRISNISISNFNNNCIDFYVFKSTISSNKYKLLKYISFVYKIGRIMFKKTLVVTEETFSDGTLIKSESRIGTDLLIHIHDLDFEDDVPNEYKMKSEKYGTCEISVN